ncbi:hypothetical protein B0A52_09120 [Exophiala mesophila]|uniref:Queuine tRNA-ribosyltransferase accessory subunit 2 n=1 Tax=Exophiala mesophila TaxID=212818 RepID=A0A438MUF6_EXOME|nr:hypothetical protein B0A52_09120 [Exophiala mesophila]
MEDSDSATVAQLPDDMIKFTVQHVAALESGARLASLTVQNRPSIQTPHYLVPTSRGVIPHLSPDTLQRHTNISAVYIGLEDFIEKSVATAPLFKTPVQDGTSILRRYIGLPQQCLSILGPRRVPVLPAPAHNTNSSIAISTSVGFRFLEAQDYNESLDTLKADISLSLADVITKDTPSSKRIEKSADRTHAWLRDWVDSRQGKPGAGSTFASIPALPEQRLSFYLSDLQDEFEPHVSGLALYSSSTIPSLTPSLRSKPMIGLDDPATPQEVLARVHNGTDLLTVPFITQASERGIALTFTYPGTPDSTPKPLGIDLWSTIHATDTSALSPSCPCYTCTRHHRAYVHHLLQANEMVGWTLLQIHNFRITDTFFASVRTSIANDTFDQDNANFERTYESEMPQTTGHGPRVRGYQAASVGGGEPKLNAKAWGKVDDQVQKLAEAQAAGADSTLASLDGDAMEIEEHGLGSRTNG